jgi:hypothetical protein
LRRLPSVLNDPLERRPIGGSDHGSVTVERLLELTREDLCQRKRVSRKKRETWKEQRRKGGRKEGKRTGPNSSRDRAT